KRNEPTYVVEVVKKIAEIKSVSIEETREQLLKNVKKMFKLA
ncbi:MAG: TatD family hydrolase, partial [Candidatus Adlerbacteria bacterium]|nr:TatD family hydrolase [Candidatus Adlerbacteria bacterium]